VLIGPEGDFTPAEYAAARAAGFLPVTLGPLVLRADTAALYALSIVHHELVTHRGVC
jgi:16S rRNA (uracil1498-N3)-methyltransferase